MARWTHLRQALHQAMQTIRQVWEDTAQQAGLSPPQALAYMAGLRQPHSVHVTEQASGFQGTVQNLAPEAAAIEHGTPAYHLPSVIRWGQTPAGRQDRQGVWYLIVPFRHLAPGGATRRGPAHRQLSWPVYRVAQRLQPGQSLTAGPSRGASVHAPGLQPYVPRFARNVRPGYTHAAAQERLRRVSGPAGSRYLTFRTLRQDSPGWWIPARPGRHLAAQVRRAVVPHVQADLAEAVRQDVLDTLREGLQEERDAGRK